MSRKASISERTGICRMMVKALPRIVAPNAHMGVPGANSSSDVTNYQQSTLCLGNAPFILSSTVVGRDGSKWKEFDNRIQEQRAAVVVGTRSEFVADCLGVNIGDDCQDDSRRCGKPPFYESLNLIARDHILGEKPPQARRIDESYVSSHKRIFTISVRKSRIQTRPLAVSSAKRDRWYVYRTSQREMTVSTFVSLCLLTDLGMDQVEHMSYVAQEEYFDNGSVEES